MGASRHNVERPDNPWGDNNVIWRDMIDPDDETNTEFHKLIADQDRSHIVREVQVLASFLPHRIPRTISEAEDIIAIGDQEFDNVREKGIEVAQADWHIISYGLFMCKILARVPIVDGKHVRAFGQDDHLPADELLRIRQSVQAYQLDHKPTEPYLSDIYAAGQYVYGNYRLPGEIHHSLPHQAILVDPDLFLKNI